MPRGDDQTPKTKDNPLQVMIISHQIIIHPTCLLVEQVKCRQLYPIIDGYKTFDVIRRDSHICGKASSCPRANKCRKVCFCFARDMCRDYELDCVVETVVNFAVVPHRRYVLTGQTRRQSDIRCFISIVNCLTDILADLSLYMIHTSL